MTKRMFRAAFLSLLAVLAIPAAAALAATAADWTTKVALARSGGHVMGNPAAPTKVVEYVSYTCSHCAHFVAEGTQPLKTGWVRGGKVSVEVRNAVRDRYDMTAALLARCGGPARFFGNHEALFANQDAWMEQLQTYEAAHRQPVPNQTPAAMFQDIAASTGLIALMTKRGYTPAQLNACLADKASLATVTAMTDEAWNKVKIPGTPGFTVNGSLLANTSSWDGLRAALPGGSK
ncbi:thioredoxin domain-containing protein [Sphingobium aquiterrae]|uniref:thioredoxin domain-containing protein n=1 Tax=Sphingobium aquiterrae TaxID=2038656 RepID=UPI0030181A30